MVVEVGEPVAWAHAFALVGIILAARFYYGFSVYAGVFVAIPAVLGGHYAMHTYETYVAKHQFVTALHEAHDKSPRGIRKVVEEQLESSASPCIKPKAIKVRAKNGETKVSINCELIVPIFGGVSAVATFVDEVIPGKRINM